MLNYKVIGWCTLAAEPLIAQKSPTLFSVQECAECKVRDMIKASKVKRDEDDQDSGEYSETVTFNREHESLPRFACCDSLFDSLADLCSKCGHVICEHFYQFEVCAMTADARYSICRSTSID